MARRKTLQCTLCERKFSRPGHLARHMNATHGANGHGQPKRKRARTGQGITPLVRHMVSHREELISQRDAIDAQLQALEVALETIRNPKAGNGHVEGRPTISKFPRPGSLKECVLEVLTKRKTPMSLVELEKAVRSSGFKTKSSNLKGNISNALTGLSGVSRVGPGVYQV